jgi:hypothetical protein
MKRRKKARRRPRSRVRRRKRMPRRRRKRRPKRRRTSRRRRPRLRKKMRRRKRPRRKKYSGPEKKRRRKQKKKRTNGKRSERSISLGIELESYSISVPSYRISRVLRFPRRGIAEKGERFTKDMSIGSEYNSRVFYTIYEAFFLLKNGLRKYIHFRSFPGQREYHTIFPVGGWIDRFAGSHIHVAFGNKKFTYLHARRLARRLHSHIPFIIALTGNSPVWRDRVNQVNSNRLLLGTKTYCKVMKRERLLTHHYQELTYNQGGKRKPPTLELRVLDAGVPEYMAAAACIVKAVALRWLQGGSTLNRLADEDYRLARDQAIHYGPDAQLFWNRHEVTVPQYVDLFFRKYEDELEQLNIPNEVIDIFKWLKKGWNQSTVVRKAVQKSRWHHRPTWERRFARRYADAIERLLDGNTYRDFSNTLGVWLPKIERVWLGRKVAKW